jgi:hypothetical protein
MVKAIPDPKVPDRYKLDGVERTLSEWARHSGIPKTTPVVGLTGGSR